MEKIYKYKIRVDDHLKISMPRLAEVLTVQTQGDTPCIWAKVDTNQPEEIREFEIFGTGHQIPELEAGISRIYIGTFQMAGGVLVYHLFELL